MDEHDDARGRPARTALRADSDRLLRAIEELRALEREKRSVEISSQPFLDLVRRVEEKAREVFRIGEQEEDDGEAAERAGSIEDADRDDDGR